MRTLLALLFLFTGLVTAHAQEQEGKLMDRLLKPNMSLQNSAEGKRCEMRGNTLTSSVPTKRFWFFQRRSEKEYSNVKQLSPQSFPTKSSQLAKQQADTSTHASLPTSDQQYSTTAFVTRDAADAGKVVQTGNDPEARPFLVPGKSQKALDQKPHEMTIDEVRELLNKNK